MKIVIASKGNPTNVKTWSGIPYYIYDALQKKGHDVEGISLDDPKEPWYYDWYRRVNYKLSKKWFWSEMEPYMLKKIASQFNREVERVNPDAVILIHGHFLAYTTFKQPTVIIHDTTFAQIINYYPEFRRLADRTINQGNSMYQRSLERATAAVFSSSWAAQSAIADYNTEASKVYTIPFGANLSSIPQAEAAGRWIIDRAQDEICRLLFLGIDWERKGGPEALRFVAELNRAGIKSSLTVVGCFPDIPADLTAYVNLVGFLRKDVAEEAEQLERLLITSTALLLPSLAECYGCVFCEANAYGLPALGRDTGGVSEIIKDGVNGLLMSDDESPEAFASRWASLWRDRPTYIAISEGARREFDERLNYDVFVDRIGEILTEKDDKLTESLTELSK